MSKTIQTNHLLESKTKRPKSFNWLRSTVRNSSENREKIKNQKHRKNHKKTIKTNRTHHKQAQNDKQKQEIREKKHESGNTTVA